MSILYLLKLYLKATNRYRFGIKGRNTSNARITFLARNERKFDMLLETTTTTTSATTTTAQEKKKRSQFETGWELQTTTAILVEIK